MTKKYVTSKWRRRARHVRNLDKQTPPQKKGNDYGNLQKKGGGVRRLCMM